MGHPKVATKRPWQKSNKQSSTIAINLNMAIPPQPSIIAGTNNLPTGRLIARKNALINPRVDEFSTQLWGKAQFIRR